MDNETQIPSTPPRRPVSRIGAKIKRDHRARRFRSQLLKVAPHLADSKFNPLIHSFARVSLLALDSYEFLRENGLVGENGELRASVDTLQRLSSTQLKLATALNLTPAALGKMRNAKPADLAAAFAEVDITDAQSE
ncbi:MAG: hypothetical protein ACLQU2_34510 [Candidatus Binataceae bacterium]